MKKLWMGLGMMTAVIAPAISIMSCTSNAKKNDDKPRNPKQSLKDISISSSQVNNAWDWYGYDGHAIAQLTNSPNPNVLMSVEKVNGKIKTDWKNGDQATVLVVAKDGYSVNGDKAWRYTFTVSGLNIPLDLHQIIKQMNFVVSGTDGHVIYSYNKTIDHVTIKDNTITPNGSIWSFSDIFMRVTAKKGYCFNMLNYADVFSKGDGNMIPLSERQLTS